MIYGVERRDVLAHTRPCFGRADKMSSANPLNIFKGPNALAQFFDPEKNPPLPLVELPEALNPLRQDGVRIFAKMLTQLPAQNVKSLPGRRAFHQLSSRI